MENTREGPKTLNITCYNVWGLKFIAKHRGPRLMQISRQIASANPPLDIVGLQECFTQRDYNTIRKETKHLLPHGKFYHSGIFGGGLVILSRWPIVESSMFRYPLNGRPTAFFRGDWFVGKGVACARIKSGPLKQDIIEVFCTHLHAPYERPPNDSYMCHRTAQAWEIAKLMRGASERGHLVIGMGDFNMLPLSFAHRLITSVAPVEDVWRIVHPDSSLGAAIDDEEKARIKPVPTAEFNFTVNGATCDSPFNTWRWPKARQKALDKGKTFQIEPAAKDMYGKRLDYIFVGTGGLDCRQNESEEPAPWRLESANLGMTERHPTLNCSLSDHFSVIATLIRDRKNYSYGSSFPLQATQKPLAAKVYDEVLAMIKDYQARERRQRRLRLGHFVLQFFVAIGCLIAVWFSPRNFVAFLLMLLSTLGLSAGVIDGLIGGLFVGSEIRALKEFEWEISNAKQVALDSDRHEITDSVDESELQDEGK